MNVLFILFTAAGVYQSFLWWWVLGVDLKRFRLQRSKHNHGSKVNQENSSTNQNQPAHQQNKVSSVVGVSVIVCFRNEASRLRKYLPLLLRQDYHCFEVVAVDDHSTDNSATIVSELARQYPNLRLVRPPHPTRYGKKDALTYGISQAQHSILLLTDADCSPASQRWLSLMTEPFSDPATDVVLGYSPYQYSPANCNAFQRYETTYTARQYFGFAARGLPYMGVGRNLAYRKRFFLQAGGLEQHANIPGGDDDLLLSHHATPQGTAWVIDPAAWTVSEPATDWEDFLTRKRRHLSVGVHYPLWPKLLLGALGASHFALYALALPLLWSSFGWLTVTLLFFRWVIVVGVMNRQELKYPSSEESQSRGLGVDWWNVVCHDALIAVFYLLMVPATLSASGHPGGWEKPATTN